jgi:hypothetical protein
MSIRTFTRFLCRRCLLLSLPFYLFFLPASYAQTAITEPATPVATEKPIAANICPKFSLIGIPRRIKLYGANLSGIQLKSEEDLIFSEYTPDADFMSLIVTVEAIPTARPGKRTLLLIDSNKEVVQSITFYLLKREDKALLQKDLLRCPLMKEEPAVKAPKNATPARP